jgi:hypothetical protein
MKKVYVLTAQMVQGNYIVEKSHFTNMKVATSSLNALVDYLITNHDLNPYNVVDSSTRDITSKDIDGQYTVTLVTFYIRTQTLKYI